MPDFFNPRRDFANVAKTQQVWIQANEPAWKKIPLRPFIRDDPTMQTLDPILKMHLEIENTSAYDQIRTIISKVLHSDMGAGEATEKQLTSIMKCIANHLTENIVSVVSENHIPGFRQIVFMNSDIIPDIPDNNNRTIRMVAVTQDGRLAMNILKGSRLAENLQSTAEMLEVFLIGRTGWKIIPVNEGRIAPTIIEHDFYRLLSFDLDKRYSASSIDLDSVNNLRHELTQCQIDTYDRTETRIHIFEILNKNINHNFDLVRMTLCNALDPNILYDMRKSQITKLHQVMWLTGGDGAEPKQIQARQQAVRAYPILAVEFNKKRYYRKTIDARESLSVAIATEYNIVQSRVGNIQGLTRQWVGCSNEYAAKSIVNQILSLPNQMIPKTRKQIQQLLVLENFGFLFFRDIMNDMDNPLELIMNRLSAEGRPWQMADRLEKYHHDDVNDAVNFLAHKLFIPAALNGIRQTGGKLSNQYYHDARQKIITSFKIRDLLDFSDRYHRNIHRWEDRLTSISFQKNWPCLMGTVELEDGHVARELCSLKDIKAQGRAENHCVGGYMSRILDGNKWGEPASLIFSIEKNGNILSTAEIHCTESDDGLQAWVKRNEGYENASPSDTASIMADQAALKITRIKPDTWHAYLDGLQRIRTEMNRLAETDLHTAACGFNPYDRAMLENVWEELSRSLPRAMRNAGIDAFIDWIGKELKEEPPDGGHVELPCA